MSQARIPENETINAESGSSSPGAILKRCREYHGTSIEEAAESTKIAVHHLMALEADHVKEFANLAYLKGFLRVYAGFLGLNPEDLMRLYERLGAPAVRPGNERKNGTKESGSKQRRFPWQKLALPAVLLLMMIATSAIFNHSPSPPPISPSPQPGVVATPVTPVQPARSSAAVVVAPHKFETVSSQKQSPKREDAVTEKNVTPDSSYLESSRGIIVRLKVVQNGSLAVSIDGAGSQGFDLTSGDVFEWKADRTIALELSNAASVETELNGKLLKPFVAPAYVVLDANGVKH